MKDELYRKVYIRSEADLPKKLVSLLFWSDKDKEGFYITVNPLDKGCMENLLLFDWYLQPIEEPAKEINTPLTDEEIEEWANTEIDSQYKGFKAMNDELPISFDSWISGLKYCKFISAIAYRNGLIHKWINKNK